MEKVKPLLLSFLICCTLSGRAQQVTASLDASILSELDSIFSQADSLAIFELLDSLLFDADFSLSSQLGVRVGYNSNVASTGRTLGISQFGLTGGLSYYHKSGIYVDASSYWSAEFDPRFYLSILSAGYLQPVTKHWSFLGEYNRFLYNHSGDSIYVPYKNSLGISNFINLKPLTFRLDYYLYFGDKVGHRIMPGIFLNIEKKNWGKIDRITLYPSFNVMLGSEQVIEYVSNASTRLELLALIRNNQPLFSEQKKVSFGAMNYSFSIPLSLSLSNWNVMASYTYNIPYALPGETLTLTNSGFASATLTRYFDLK